jgi:hypothetical protein
MDGWPGWMVGAGDGDGLSGWVGACVHMEWRMTSGGMDARRWEARFVARLLAMEE